ncbi:hypothetical protein M0812_16634 [Anaeramoeba flamelloides]|uniref:Tyrosine-protein kinase ephrin type A/B receptor-like domain-containing protein n=1 Tax=Anaeramoeba flamelloides TaxID=1746091 RepID=A0AAV7Z8Z3_9EUKA|nr:hypothetical protein M0812_16634 [Anaeramoeba flamelloides]
MEGKNFCIDCPYDSYQEDEGKNSCLECPAGEFTASTGSTSFDDCFYCEKGTYWNRQLSKERRVGRKGQGQSQGRAEDEQSKCFRCMPGTYQDEEGQTQCKKCPIGTFNHNDGSIFEKDCLECPIGKYNEHESQSSCNLCPLGKYQNSQGNSVCIDCPKGSYTDKRGSTACKLCSSGTYQNENGGFQCKNCAFDTWQSNTGASECSFCPLFSETLSTKSKSIKECFCSLGYYGKPGEVCQKCPENGVCNKFNQYNPLPKPGYWSSNKNPNYLIKCNIYESCPGYEIETCDHQLGYGGYQCSECLNTFYKFESQCQECPTNNNSRLILFFILFILLIILLLIIAKKGKNYFGSFSIFINFFQVIAILPKLEFNWPIKLINFFQFFSIVNFNIDFLALECSINLNYTEKWFIIMLLPFILILILFIIYLTLFMHSLFVKFTGPILINKFPNLCIKSNRANQSKFLLPFSYLRYYLIKIFLNSWSKENLKIFLNTCINVFVASLLILYLILALKIFEFFDCDYSSNLKKYIFQPEKSHYCFDDWWYQILPFVIIFMILYIIGIPIFFGIMLWYHSKKVNEKVFNQRLSLLYSRYKIEYFFWEIIIIFRKFFIVIFEIYLTNYPLVQIILLICCLLLSIIIQNIYKPYNTPHRNFYEFSLLTVTLFIFFISILFLTNEKTRNKDLYSKLADLVIIIFSTVLCILLIISFLEIKNRIKYNIKKSKTKNNLKYLNNHYSKNSHFSHKKEPIYLTIKSKKNLNFHLLLKFFAQFNHSKNKKFNILSKIIVDHYLSKKNKNHLILNSIQEKWNQNTSFLILKWYKEKANLLWKYRFCQFFMKFLEYHLHKD